MRLKDVVVVVVIAVVVAAAAVVVVVVVVNYITNRIQNYNYTYIFKEEIRKRG